MSRPDSPVRSFRGLSPALGERVYIDARALVLGDVHIGDDSSVWPQATVRGDMHRIRIGARTSIQDGAVLHITHAGPFNPDGYPLTVGSDVTVGHAAILHGCSVGDRVLIGMGAILMDGAVIPDDVVIAAGALVTPGKVLSSGRLYAGTPAREQRALSEREMQFFTYSAANYVRLKDEYLFEREGR
jgi:carbonic anhydrase/acetyltransferase-like protein (isoleucine patch superfamily)